MELDKRATKGHGLLSQIGTSALITLAIAAISAAITFVILLRQAGQAYDREAFRAQHSVPTDQSERLMPEAN